jgi:hypothetical protein
MNKQFEAEITSAFGNEPEVLEFDESLYDMDLSSIGTSA